MMLPRSFVTLKTGSVGTTSHRAARFIAGSRRALATGIGGVNSPRPRLRFAPSPTGHLHLGGLRTALFNHLFAKRYGGQWLLRIEDTDQSRLVPGAVESLQESLSWVGLEYDEGAGVRGSRGPYIQSERLELYRSYVDRLLHSGRAYRDFRPPQEELYAADRKSTSSLRRFVDSYVPPDEDEARTLIRDGKTFVVRLKLQAVDTVHEDMVYGHLSFPWDNATTDPILLKSDGWPTYHLANVVDDHEMGITHVLRGEEWISSIPKHLAIYAALGLEPPHFAHLPLLMNPDGSKLSKRSGDVHVNTYRQKGWEPQALINFVALMGYNHHKSDTAGEPGIQRHHKGGSPSVVHNDREVMTLSQLIEEFEPSRISHSRATMDPAKLAFLNRRHLATQPKTSLVPRLRSYLSGHNVPDEYLADDQFLANAINLVSERADRLVDVPAEGKFLFSASPELPEWTTSDEALEAERQIGRTAYIAALDSVLPRIEELPEWRIGDVQGTTGADAEARASIQNLLQDATRTANDSFAKTPQAMGPTEHNEGGKARKAKRPSVPLLKALRHALTARKSGPAVVDILLVLGKRRSLERLKAAQRRLEDQAQVQETR